MADEGAVDVDEGRDTPDPGGSRPAVAAGVRLSEVQEAYGRYTEHATHCWACRSVDERCDVGEWLHRAYRQVDEAASRRLIGEQSG
jgi:hypothetical protein